MNEDLVRARYYARAFAKLARMFHELGRRWTPDAFETDLELLANFEREAATWEVEREG